MILAKSGKLMTDVEFLVGLSKVTDPREACRVLVDNERLLGFDAYYVDLRKALIAMCLRCGTHQEA